MLALRIALIHAGRILEDRTLPPGKRQTVTVGADPRSTFCVPMGDLPQRARLFSVSRSEVTLLNEPGAEGRVDLGSGERGLEEHSRTIALGKGAKGRVKVGDVTVLFQMVTPPPVAAPPELPAGARGVLGQLDRAFVAAIACSFAAHLLGAGYLIAQPTPVDPELSLQDIEHNRFAAVLLPIPKPPAEPAQPKAKDPVAEATKPEVKKPMVANPQPAHKPIDAQAARSRVSRMGMLAVIGSAGGEGGVFGDLMGELSRGGSVAQALSGAGVRVATAEDARAGGPKGSDIGSAVSVGALGTNGVRQVALVDRDDSAVRGRAVMDPVEVEAPEISRDELAKWVGSRRAGIQACYEREIKRNRSLAGRLVLKFVVTSRGRVTQVDLSERTLESDEVVHCITSIASHWVLPFAPADEVPVAIPFVFSPVN